MPKFRDKRTGKIYEGTEDEILKQIEAEKSDPVFRTKPGTEPTIKAPSSADTFFNTVGRFIPSALTASGGVAGGVVGGPIGSAAGAGAGSVIGKLFQQLAPSYLGEYKPSGVGEVAGDIGIDVATDLMGTGLAKGASSLVFPSARREMSQLLTKKLFPGKLTTDQLDAVRSDPNFPITLGQVNKIVGTGENVFSPELKREFVKSQDDYIAKQLNRHIFAPEDIVQTAQANAATNVAGQKGQSKVLYQNFDPHIAANTQNAQFKVGETVSPILGPQGQQVKVPKYETVKIEGAIPVNNSMAFANKVGDQVDEILGPSLANTANIGAGSGYPLVQLKTELDKIRKIQTGINPQTGQAFSNPIAGINQLKAVTKGIEEFLGSDIDKTVKNRLQGTLKALRDTIKTDIDQGVKGWGPQAYKDYNAAQDYYSKMSQRLNSKLADELRIAGKDPEQTYTAIAKDALSDPQKTRQFRDVTDDRATLKQLFLNDIVDKSWDAEGKRFDPGKMKQLLWDQKYIAKEAVPSQTLTNLNRLLERASIIGPHSENANVALKMWLARGGLNLAIGAGSLALGKQYGSTPLIAGGSLLLGAGGVNQFIKRMAYDPKMARIATGLLTADPKTPLAKQGSAALLGLMKGLQVSYLSPDGREIPSTVNDQGKVIPNSEN